MLKEFLCTKPEEEDIGNIWFQQDDATCHTGEATHDVLRPVFENRIISRRVDVVCYRWTIIWRLPRKISVTPARHSQLML